MNLTWHSRNQISFTAEFVKNRREIKEVFDSFCFRVFRSLSWSIQKEHRHSESVAIEHPVFKADKNVYPPFKFLNESKNTKKEERLFNGKPKATASTDLLDRKLSNRE